MENFVKVFPLKAATKNRSTVIQVQGGGYRVLTTGAAETVLHKCMNVLNDSGKVSTLDDEEKREIIENIILPMASEAQRVIALAYRYCCNVDSFVVVMSIISGTCTLTWTEVNFIH